MRKRRGEITIRLAYRKNNTRKRFNYLNSFSLNDLRREDFVFGVPEGSKIFV